MYFDLNGRELRVKVLENDSFRSKHTGNELQKITIEITANGEEAHEDLKQIFSNAKEKWIYSTDGNGKLENKWKCINDSYYYRSGYPKYRHTVEFEEMEELNLDSLTLNGTVELNPYDYSERFSEDALVIDAKVKLAIEKESSLLGLMKARKYFSVIRSGISNEVKEMRFGLVLWSKHDDGDKYHLHLVERCYDDNEKPMRLFEPMMSNMQNAICENSVILKDLLDLLSRKGIISKGEIEAIHTNVSAQIFEEDRKMYLVRDIDTW
jgi:hypothetical protein